MSILDTAIVRLQREYAELHGTARLTPSQDVAIAKINQARGVHLAIKVLEELRSLEDSEARRRQAERTRADELRDWERCGKPHEHYPHEHVAIFNEGPTAPLHCDGKPKGNQ